MNLPFNALQKGIYDRVTADIPTVPIYCPFAPTDALMPYITLSGMSATDASEKSRARHSVACTFDVISTAERSFEELNGILDSLCRALSRLELTLSDGWTHVRTKFESGGVASEVTESGAWQHGTLLLRLDVMHVHT